MNFSYLVENGSYSKDDLQPEQKAFVDGMEHIRNAVLDSFLAGIIVESSATSESILSKIKNECAETNVKELKADIDAEINKYIVYQSDVNFTESEAAHHVDTEPPAPEISE